MLEMGVHAWVCAVRLAAVLRGSLDHFAGGSMERNFWSMYSSGSETSFVSLKVLFS